MVGLRRNRIRQKIGFGETGFGETGFGKIVGNQFYFNLTSVPHLIRYLYGRGLRDSDRDFGYVKYSMILLLLLLPFFVRGYCCPLGVDIKMILLYLFPPVSNILLTSSYISGVK
jgi:hypothetical protein